MITPTQQLNGQAIIIRDPAIRRGQPVLAGTGLRVADVAIAYVHHQCSASEIAANYGISMAQIHSALAYYYQHHDELTAAIRKQFEEAVRFKEQNFGNPKPTVLSG